MIRISESARSAALRKPELVADITDWKEYLGCSSDDLSAIRNHTCTGCPLGSDAFVHYVGNSGDRIPISEPTGSAALRKPGLMADTTAWKDSLECSSDGLSPIRKHTRTGRPLGSDAFLRYVESAASRMVCPKEPGPRRAR